MLDWYHGGRGLESRQDRELLILNKKELLKTIEGGQKDVLHKENQHEKKY